MKYLLVTPSGRQFAYYVKDCAVLFQQIFGGQIHMLEHGSIKDS
jgi:hypothetical protein